MTDRYSALLLGLDGVGGQAAADCGQLLAAAAVDFAGDGGPGVFPAAAQLRRLTGSLAEACSREDAAEARHQATGTRFREAHAMLVTVAQGARRRLGAEDPRLAVNRHAAGVIDKGLERWLNPYAADAAGASELAGWAAELQALPLPLRALLGPLLAAMQDAREAGAAWDAAEAARAGAIAERAKAEQAWREAVRALVAVVGPGPWLNPIGFARRPSQAQDTWFED